MHQEKHLHLLEDEKGISGNDRIREAVDDFIERKIQEERSVGKNNAAGTSASPRDASVGASKAPAGGGDAAGTGNATPVGNGGSASVATPVGSDAAVVGTVASPRDASVGAHICRYMV